MYASYESMLSQSCLTLCNPMGCSPGLSVQQILQARFWSGSPCPSPGHLPNPGIEPRSSTLQVDSLPPELTRKPKSTGVGSEFLLQDIFPNQESNSGLHCRRILYHLSSEGSQILCILVIITYFDIILWDLGPRSPTSFN